MRLLLSMARHLLVLFVLLISVSGCTALKQSMKATPSLANAMGMADIPLKDLEKKYTTREDKWLDIGVMKIHYRDVGQGKPIVLVHGIFSSLQTWDGWMDELRRTNRVITLDVPGYGLTGPIPDELGYSDATLVSLFSKFVDGLDLKQFAIAGNSLGAFIAASYAAQNPDRVTKLILIDPIGYPQKTPWICDLVTAPGMSTLARFVAPPVLVTMNLQDVYGDTRKLTKDTINRYVQMSQRPGAKGSYVDTLIAMKKRSESDTPLPFFNIKAPTLLMWGEKDQWVPLELSKRWLADIQGSKLITYPGVGHIPMEEIPDQTVADAVEFLGDYARRTPASTPTESTTPTPAAPQGLQDLLDDSTQKKMEEMAPY